MTEPTTFPTEEERYEEFGRMYDETARSENWEETYSMLDEYSQQEFTEEAWVAKHQALRDASGPPSPLESVNAENETKWMTLHGPSPSTTKTGPKTI